LSGSETWDPDFEAARPRPGFPAARSGLHSGMSVINPNPFTTRPEIEGTFGVVASTH
jgi:hypothetical protein